jgi:ubiquinone/menaquinone biosynthesis C-methylase UbiE
MPTMHFYEEVIRKAAIGLDESILVVCGGTFDIEILRAIGFRKVTISNVDERYDEQAKPFSWSHQDSESLGFPDSSFDWAFVHAGLHHCGSPHKALIEMYRVARKGVLVIEARDSIVMRAAARLGFTSYYEIEAVSTNDWVHGGLRNGPIPNFVYRWTEREIRKTIESAFPQWVNEIKFFYGMRMPAMLPMSSPLRRVIAAPLWLGARVFQRLVPRQCNSFGFTIRPKGLKPWMNPEGTALRRGYHRAGFDPKRVGN